jgi:hypothetical protein
VVVPEGSGVQPQQPTKPEKPQETPQAFVPQLPSLKQRDPVRAEIENANIGPLYSQTDPTLISIMVQPTGITRSGDHLSYVIPENQDAFMAAFQNSLKHYEKGEYVEKGPTAGFYICYQGEKWRMMTNGTMIWFYGEGGTIEAAELYGLCLEELEKTGLEGTVRPEELVGIQSATLEWNGTHTVTDKNALAYLERLFANSRELYSGAACPFYGMLTLKLENGAEKVIAIAVDDCCAWMSNGVYYQYTDGDLEEELANSVFYSLFYPDIIHGALAEGKDPLEWIPYMHWSLYDSLYGKQETLKLMEALGEYSGSSGDYSVTFYCLNGLDEKYRPIYAEFLAKLAEGDKGAFAYDYFNTYSELRERITALLAEHWNLTPEETDARLREYRNAQ